MSDDSVGGSVDKKSRLLDVSDAVDIYEAIIRKEGNASDGAEG